MSKLVISDAINKFKIIQPYLNGQVTIAALSEETKISPRSLHRWVAEYKKIGLDGLKTKTRSDKGHHRNLSEDLINLIVAMALQKPKRTITSIYRTVKQYCHDKTLPLPSYAVVYKIIYKLPCDLVTLAHDGLKQYQQKYDLIYIRESSRSNEIWQADHTMLDIYVVDGKNTVKRPWLSIIMDDYSRAIAGYYLSFQAPSAIQTALALHQAIWRKNDKNWLVCGIPEVLYTDHGCDFTSHHIEAVCVGLKINLIFSTAGTPRGRGKIERFFSTINQCVLQDLPGFIQKNNNLPKQKNLLTLRELENHLKKYILDEYNQQPHSTTKEVPNIRWQDKHFLPNLPASKESLDSLLLTVSKPRCVQRDGIKFQGFRYFSTVLASFVGSSVIIRYDPRDLAEIRVFYNGHFLCRAISQDLESQIVSLKEITEARKKRRTELKASLKRSCSIIDTLLKNTVIQEQEENIEITEPRKSLQQLKRYVNE